MENPFYEIMATRSDEKLLGVLREHHDYLPSAVEAALQELRKRNVSGFEMEAAIDQSEWSDKHFEAGLRREEVLLWLLLAIFAITPLSTWRYKRYHNLGFKRKASQFLDTTLIGMTIYMSLFLLLLMAKNSGFLR
jgi:hypothetical protein